jgi:hypothetical protein
MGAMRMLTRDDLELLKLEASRQKIAEMRAGLRLLKRIASAETHEAASPEPEPANSTKEHS